MMRKRWIVGLGLALALAAGACQRDSTAPADGHSPSSPGDSAVAALPRGLVAITLTGIGTAQMSTSARTPGAVLPGGAGTFSPLASAGTAGGDGTIQLEPLSTSSFTDGVRGSGGVRYVYATFRVRNAQTDSTAYDTPRHNLTFFAAATGSTVDSTAISALNRFDGSAADPSVAVQVLPTGAVLREIDGSIGSLAPDVLQLLTEADVAAIPPAAGATLLPYGFVVRNASDGSRTLPASPAAGQYDGVVTFAFKIPLQSTAAADPFTVTALFQAVDDDTTRLTESLEEQTAAGDSAVAARATAIGATQVTLLPGGRYSGTLPARVLCAVRTAGTAAAPTTYLVNATPASLQGLTPDPFAADGSAEGIAATGAFTATTTGTCTLTPTGGTFVVNGSESGRHFLGQSYTGGGTTTLATPQGIFWPGEEVEVALTTGLGISTPLVARYRVATALATGFFLSANDLVSNPPNSVALGDVNGDGKLDVITAKLARTT